MIRNKIYFCVFPLIIFCFSSLNALDGTIVSTRGKVEVQDGSEWKAVSVGDKIEKGAVLSTGFKSEVGIKIGNSTFIVEALSRMTLEQVAEQNGNQASQMFLDTGSVRANVKPVENKRVAFTVRSPVATASVRGTAGRFSSNGKLTSTESTWAIWKTPKNQQGSSVVADTPSQESEASGDILSAIVAAPSNGVKPTSVSQGMSAAVSSVGSVVPPVQMAVQESVLSNSATVSQSASESKTSSSVVVSTQNTTVKAKGSISVVVNFEE